jgi:putative inorganic carbon (HCO3(-)) transporter
MFCQYDSIKLKFIFLRIVISEHQMKIVKYCNWIIEYSFYSLFLLVPLLFSGSTSELFELNKMWYTFGITAIIGAAWACKMIAQKKIVIQRTPIDIVLMLFLLSQIISTIFSLDPYVSWWGYYSRFNGGLLSTICYILLYYAFVSNLTLKHVSKSLIVTLCAGLLTALWGFPSHFGYDPTCLVFRGTLDTTCWTDAFKPTIRTFSTLGQPAWFAAYLALVLPIAMAFCLKFKDNLTATLSFAALAIFFYISLIFTDTRAGFIAFWVANLIFWAAIYFKNIFPQKVFLKSFLILNIAFFACSFILGSPIGELNKFTLREMMPKPQAAAPAATNPTTAAAPAAPVPTADNITDSGDIRILVWKGAIDSWKNNPLFGTGVETFAFAYYQSKSPAHNLTSEWDYLYNKAHNEYLNYLATTGIFGLGTYLAVVGFFLFLGGKWFVLSKKHEHEKHKESELLQTEQLFTVSLAAGFVSMLVSNFFGFSVVIINLYIFLIPAFVFIIAGLLDEDHVLNFAFGEAPTKQLNAYQWTGITVFVLIAGWMLVGLSIFWQADVAYALGNNLDKTGNFQEAYPQLVQAVKAEPGESTYQDELAINLAAIAAALYAQKDIKNAEQFATNAISMNDQVIAGHPNNVVYWKNRVRLFYTLSASDTANQGKYLTQAVQAIDKAKALAPTDAKISYNQGILYGQVGQLQKATDILEQTVKLKPNYTDAYVALGLFYHERAVDQSGKVTNPEMQQKAITTYQYILDKLSPNNSEVKKSLDTWK